MDKNKCINCIERKRCKDDSFALLFFLIGIIATIAIRIVTVLMHFNPLYGKLAWYIGVGGFFIFFAYKYKINKSRSKIIIQNKLIDKLIEQKQLSKDENELVAAILCSLSSKKEEINYFFIFTLSAISLVVAFYFDFIS